MNRFRNIGMLLAVLATALTASLAGADVRGDDRPRLAGAEKCKNASTPVHRLSKGAVRSTVMCLVNAERRRHARNPLSRSKALQRASQHHANKMAATNCLSHQCPGEGSLASRIRRFGYTRGANSWKFAENTGCGLSAEAMVMNWMASRYHRINIVDPRFKDIGVGYTDARVEGRCKRSYGTFAVVFAVRKPD